MKAAVAVLAALTVALTAPAVAPAGTWLPPVDVSEAGDFSKIPQLAVDPQGNALALWTRRVRPNVMIQAAARPAGGSWQSTPDDLTADTVITVGPQVAVDAEGNATALWEQVTWPSHVRGGERPAGGAWQSLEPGYMEDAALPQIALDGDGDATAVWQAGSGPFSVYALSRPAGGAWHLDARLTDASDDVTSPEVASDPEGNAVAVWSSSAGGEVVIRAAERQAAGAWGLPRDLSAPGEVPAEPQVAMDPAGNAIAVWSTYADGHSTIQAAVRPAGGAWGPVTDLATDADAGQAQIAMDGDGNAIAVWYVSDGPTFTIQAARRPAGGVWGPVADLATGPDAGQPEVAMDAAGNAMAVWYLSDGTDVTIQAARRPADGPWAAAEDLSAPTWGAGAPQVAFDAQGNAIAVWHWSDDTSDTIQAARYDAAPPRLDAVSIPAAGTAGQPVSFSVSPWDWSAAIASTRWSFGDGQEATGPSLTHVFATAGTYPVTVTTTDDAGYTTTASGSVTIGAAPAPAPAPEPPPPPPPLPPPVPVPVTGETANVTPVSGKVLVKLPGTTRFVEVDAAGSIPVGSTVDATKGRVKITTALPSGQTQSADFFGGMFVLRQDPDGTTEARLTGGSFAGPAASSRRPSARPAAGPRVRRLWGSGKGRFRTRGRFGSATVRGTTWVVEDRTDGTVLRVTEGSISVRDFTLRRTTTLRAPGRYFAPAKAPCTSRRRFDLHVRGRDLAAVRVVLNGRPLEVRHRGSAYVADVDLRKRPKGRFRVRVTARLKNGAVVRRTRWFRTCVPPTKAASVTITIRPGGR